MLREKGLGAPPDGSERYVTGLTEAGARTPRRPAFPGPGPGEEPPGGGESGPRCEAYPAPKGVSGGARGRSLVGMSPMPSSVSARSAAEVNAEIRDLWQRSGGCLTPQDEAEYQRLLVEWAAATGGSARTAA